MPHRSKISGAFLEAYSERGRDAPSLIHEVPHPCLTKVMEVTAPPDDKRHSSSLAGSAPGKATEDMALVERDSAENAEPPDYDAMVEARRAKLEAKFEDMPF